MISNRNIIFFGDDWGRYPSTAQHLGKLLAKNNNVYWIGSFGLRKPTFKIKDFIRLFEKGKQILLKSKKQEVVKIVNPFILPFHDFSLIRWINNIIVQNKLIRIIKKNNLCDILIITMNPLVNDIVKNIKYKSFHYLCLDDWSQFDGAYKILNSEENKLINNVDLCISTSKKLFNKCENSKNNMLISQGVDDSLINNNLKIEESLINLKKPIVGFFGLISNWVDIELIIKTAIKLPDINFVIIGKVAPDVAFKNYPRNIIYLGEINFENLSKYANTFDIGIIPFKINELTISVNPLKLLEYFAFGIPVVSTNLPEVSKYNELVYIAKNENEFVDKINIAIVENSIEMKNKRIEIAKCNSWENILEKISIKILEVEKNK